MEPLRVSLPCLVCGVVGCDWCVAEDPCAREEVTPTTPSDCVVVAVDAVGVVHCRDEELDETSPISESELEALGRQLSGWHAGSCRYVYRWAAQVTRAEFFGIYQSVRDSESARNPVGVLSSSLRSAVESSCQQEHGERAAAAAQRFGYGKPSLTEVLRADPERWIRTVGVEFEEADVDAYLAAQVADDLERYRLRKLYEELRAA